MLRSQVVCFAGVFGEVVQLPGNGIGETFAVDQFPLAFVDGASALVLVAQERGQVIILATIAFFIRFIARSPPAIRWPISLASLLT